MLPIINIGPLALPAPQLIVLVGFWIGLELAEKHAPFFRVDPGKVYNLILVSLVSGLVGARLIYAAQSPAAFLQSPLNLLALRPDMLDATGGWLAAGLAGLIYGRVRQIPLWPMLDALTTLFIGLSVTFGLSHLASGDAFGAPTRLPWAIELWGEQRHPSQVYETLAALLVGIAVWPGGRLSSAARQPGREGLRWWMFLAVTAIARILLESFRGDSLLLWNTLRQAQAFAWVILAISLWQIGRRIQPNQTAPGI